MKQKKGEGKQKIKKGGEGGAGSRGGCFKKGGDPLTNYGFIPHVYYFSYHPWIAASEGRSLTTQQQEHPCPILLEFCHSSPLYFKNHKKTEIDKKILACETLTLTKGFLISSCRCSKQSVSCLLTLNCSEDFIRWGFFQICSGNNNTLLLLYACETINLIHRGVISLYVQE